MYSTKKVKNIYIEETLPFSKLITEYLGLALMSLHT